MRKARESKTSREVTRRQFLASVAAGPLVAWAVASQYDARQNTSDQPTAWIENLPLVIVGNWDDAPLFSRRRGGGEEWQREEYRQEHTDETVKKLQALGVTMAIIRFYKGFGLAAEREHIEDARRLAALCHGRGIKVGVYVGSTIMYETFLLEKPEAKDWFVPDYLGRPVIYDHQTFRKRVYFMHPGYREYMKQVLKIAIQDVQADLIHFDNTSMQAEPAIFHHPLAIEDFREFLRSKLTPEALERRLGFRDPRHVLPPKCDWPLATIDDPLFQEWTDFRCYTLSRYYEEMAAFIHALNPAVVFECNPHVGLSGLNTQWFEGVDYPRLLAHTQAVWSEEGNAPEVTPEGVLVSKIRTYKMATQLGNRIFTYTGVPYGGTPPREAQMKLEMAEAMAHNRQCLGMVGRILSVERLPESARRYIQFFVKNFRLYRDIESAADVAVLHSFPTLAFNNDLPYQSTWLFEQTLIQAKVPFDIIFDQHLKNVSKYRVLVLADQECMTGEHLDSIRAHVRNGGGLVATELTSLYTEWRERRVDFGLADLLAVHALPPEESAPVAEEIRNGPPIRNGVGRGRVVYIPRVEPSVEKPSTQPMTSRYWRLPLNWEGLIDSVRWAAGDNPLIDVKAPLTVTAELVRQKETGALLLHLINYDADRNPSVKDIRVRLRLPKTSRVSRISLLSPDRDEALSIPFTVNEGTAAFTVPSLETYSLVEAS